MENTPIKIFIVYSRKDIAHKERLIVSLAMLRRKKLIETWHDQDIHPGQVWDEEIKNHLNKADVVIALMSPDFIASNYIYDTELNHAFEQKKQIIPIVLRACSWKLDERLAKYQVLPNNSVPITSWNNADEAWLSVEEGIVKVISFLVEKRNKKEENKTNIFIERHKEDDVFPALYPPFFYVWANNEIPIEIWIDNELAGTIRGGETLKIELEIGIHTIYFRYRHQYDVGGGRATINQDEKSEPQTHFYNKSLIYKYIVGLKHGGGKSWDLYVKTDYIK